MQIEHITQLKVDKNGHMGWIKIYSSTDHKADNKRNKNHIPRHSWFSNRFVLNRM